MKITFTNEKVNFEKNQIITISSKYVEILTNSSLINKEYLIYLNYRTYKIVCPIVKNEDGEFTVIVPAFKMTNSNIPVFVHLYAIATYLSSGESMRKVALKVKKLFGLETFSHSTISRTLKKMISSLEEKPEAFKSEDPKTPKLIVRKHWKRDYIKKAKHLLSFLLPVLAYIKDDIIEKGTKLSYDFYHKNQEYIIKKPSAAPT